MITMHDSDTGDPPSCRRKCFQFSMKGGGQGQRSGYIEIDIKMNFILYIRMRLVATSLAVYNNIERLLAVYSGVLVHTKLSTIYGLNPKYTVIFRETRLNNTSLINCFLYCATTCSVSQPFIL